MDSMDSIENIIEVNRFARRNRHLRVFSKSNMLRIRLKGLATLLSTPFSAAINSSIFSTGRRFFESIGHILPIAPQKRLMFQAGVVAVTGILMSSITSAGTFSPVAMDYSDDYIESYSLPGDILVADESGYVVKVNPQTEQSNRVGLTDYAVHTVESGETLSVIAAAYGIDVKTIMWENNMGDANSLRIGQSLLIPPVDGIGYKVQSGDTLDKIASKYKIDVEKIIAQNGLDGSTIEKGQQIFLPGAVPIAPPVSVASGYRNVSGYTNVRVNAPSSDAIPAIGKMFIFPTHGGVTQGYSSAHYALDIADRSKPPIWAAAGGTVEKASFGTWGGGYGNHIIVNHGNGVKTLYAHMSSLNVSVGDTVSQGDVIGIMGNTGRVYGATGIHLHWEVIINGVRVNPYNYF